MGGVVNPAANRVDVQPRFQHNRQPRRLHSVAKHLPSCERNPLLCEQLVDSHNGGMGQLREMLAQMAQNTAVNTMVTLRMKLQPFTRSNENRQS